MLQWEKWKPGLVIVPDITVEFKVQNDWSHPLENPQKTEIQQYG